MNKEKCSICKKPMGNSLSSCNGLPTHSKCVKTKRWKPKNLESYYYVDLWGDIGVFAWFDDERDKWNYHIGNCHKTRKEAVAYRKKLLNLGKV